MTDTNKSQKTTSHAPLSGVVESSFDFVDWTLNKARIGASGTIIFESPYYSVICKKLGIKYTDLSRLGKAMLRADCIDAYNLDRDELRDSEYYLGF